MAVGQTLHQNDLHVIRTIANKTIRDTGYTRDYYSYPAKFLAHLPRELIRRFTEVGDLVFDGFSGGGTTGLEAMLLDRRFVGYDINPFAVLISRVKTTRLDTERLQAVRAAFLSPKTSKRKAVLDAEDRQLMGGLPAAEVENLAWQIDQIEDQPIRDFFRLALIHSLKILGRRDFRGYQRSGTQATFAAFDKFERQTGPSVMPLFAARTKKMIAENAVLSQKPKYRPSFILGSSHETILKTNEVNLIITSPPYKDLDVEYMQIQIQRPWEHRSKRSDAIARILDVDPVDKNILTGGRGSSYWDNIFPTFKEAHRVLRRGAFAFWWIGFKDGQDKEDFEWHLGDSGFKVLNAVRALLSDNRAASSRSTHHGRETGMLKHDYLWVTVKE